jgi:hypothetical protein
LKFKISININLAITSCCSSLLTPRSKKILLSANSGFWRIRTGGKRGIEEESLVEETGIVLMSGEAAAGYICGIYDIRSQLSL